MATNEQAITAYDLGEDGEQWMVEETLDHAEAERAVRVLWEEQGVTADYEKLLNGSSLQFTSREDWWWQPVHEDHPDDDAMLRHGPESMTLFAGVLVTL